METASRVTFNWSASCCCVWASSSSNDACNSLFRNFFGGLPRSSFLASKIAASEFFKPLKALWFTKRMLTVSFDKHSMRFCSSFLHMVTENQCSTLLQTMLLYETCVVLSRKCLWYVNEDFWHQWRSLVITTLSARAVYRQIPLSYLQIW